jgi:DNA-directed RNA polymerase subunit N (RpoN/RPB10)
MPMAGRPDHWQARALRCHPAIQTGFLNVNKREQQRQSAFDSDKGLNKKDVLDDIGEKAYFCRIFVGCG